MLSFFKSNNPGVVIFYLVYIVAFRICLWFVDLDTSYVFNHKEPLSATLFAWLQTLPVNYKLLGGILSGVLCFVQALIINAIVNNNKITAKKTYLGGAVFIIFASFFKENLLLSPASVALTFIIIATGKMFSLIRKEKSYGDIYDIGFLVAIATLFYLPSVLFIIFAYVGLSSMRAFSYREWASVLAGFVSPFFVAFTWYFFNDQYPGYLFPQSFMAGLNFSIYDRIQIGALVLCSGAALLLLPAYLYSSLIQVRKFTITLIVVFFIILVAFLLQQQISLNHWVFLSLPIGIITTMVLFQIKNPVFSEVAHLVLVLLVFAGQYIPLLNLI